jgi:hypothetical protein
LEPPAQITSPVVRALAAYWTRIRGDRFAPSWREIDPAAIKACLPYLIVAEVSGEPFDLRYRLTGSEIVLSYGYDPTGKTLRSFDHASTNATWLALYGRLIEERRPVFGQYVPKVRQSEAFLVDSVTLPLSRDGSSVDRIIEAEDWSMAPGVRRGQMQIDEWRFEMLG